MTVLCLSSVDLVLLVQLLSFAGRAVDGRSSDAAWRMSVRAKRGRGEGPLLDCGADMRMPVEVLYGSNTVLNIYLIL